MKKPLAIVFLFSLSLSPALVLAVPDADAPAASEPQSSTPSQDAPKPPSEQEVKEFERQLMNQFKKANNYSIEGRVGQIDVAAGAMIVTRDELPPVLLVAPGTVPVKVDGEKAALTDVKVGSEVRATFNITQNFPIALSVEAKSPKESPEKKQEKNE